MGKDVHQPWLHADVVSLAAMLSASVVRLSDSVILAVWHHCGE